MSFFGRIIHRLDSVDSTNNYANHLVEHNLAENGTVVVADFQTQGKGQRGKHWESHDGLNLTCSFIFFPANLSVERSYLLNCWISCALVQLLEKFSIQGKVKWPNDIYVGPKKIAGVLIESVVHGTKLKSCTIGIGLNMNQTSFDGLNATSMLHETGSVVPINELLQRFCFLLNELPFDGFEEATWRSMYTACLYGLNEELTFEVNHRPIQGIIQGISTDGQLVILMEGQTQRFAQGQITLIPPSVL